MTQPTEGEILKTCETEDGSMSLSYEWVSWFACAGEPSATTHSNFLLGQHNGTVLASHTDRGDVGRRDSLECIFYSADRLLVVREHDGVPPVVRRGRATPVQS